MSCCKSVLYIDDDADDREFLVEAFRQVGPSTQVLLAENGIKGIQILVSSPKSELPGLIVLDLNMPFADGREIYRQLREDKALSRIPVAILTSSQNPRDEQHFSRQGTCFFSKPDDFRALVRIADELLSLCVQ